MSFTYTYIAGLVVTWRTHDLYRMTFKMAVGTGGATLLVLVLALLLCPAVQSEGSGRIECRRNCSYSEKGIDLTLIQGWVCGWSVEFQIPSRQSTHGGTFIRGVSGVFVATEKGHRTHVLFCHFFCASLKWYWELCRVHGLLLGQRRKLRVFPCLIPLCSCPLY